MNKNIIALGFVSFFTDMASSMVTTVLPLFIVYVLNEGVDKLGYVIAVTTFVSYIFRILFGYMSDRYQVVKPFVVTGYLVSAFTKPMLYFANGWQEIAFLRGLERMGKAIRSATKDSLISAYSQNRSGKNFGFHKMMDVAGEMSGAIIAFLALFYLGKDGQVFRDIFAFTIIPGIIAVVIVLFFVKDVPYKKKSKEFNLKDDFHLLPMLFVYFGAVFFMFGDSYFIVAAKSSFSMEYIPLLVILFYFTQTVLSYYLGVKIDELGSGKIFFYSVIFGILSLAALYFDFIILGFILLGIFTVGTLNSIRSYISNNAENKSTVYGIFYGGIAVFNSLGAVIIGIIWKNYGLDKALIFSLVGLVLIIFFYRMKYAE
jgi:MFS family permease